MPETKTLHSKDQSTNEYVVRELYASAEVKDVDRYISLFSEDGYFFNTEKSASITASLAMVLALGAAAVWPQHAAASLALAQKYACVACHQPATKVLGPSWKDIGAKYGDGKGTAAQLAASIKDGSSGKWGAMPMPPQAQVPDTDLQALAQWLLDGAK